ncbi:MAG TPA: TonB-dependent receptor [Gemmatimonadales bacterium]|nr:TonB-dependent receptor [Gemmatimonadales bacterium]
MNATLVVLALVLQQPQDTVVLKPVVVTATRVPVAADLVASAVTVLRGTDLVTRGVRTVADALEAVAGVHVVTTGSFGGQEAIFVRGGESDYVKVLLDGVPLNQAGGGIDLANLTTDNIDRIEIVRGPVSVLYGSDAVTGVVQIFSRSTNTGTGSFALGAEAEGGTYGSTNGALEFGGRARSVEYSTRVSRFTSDGLYPYNNQYRNTVASAHVALQPDANTALGLTYRYGDDIYHFPTDGSGFPVDSNQRSRERGPLFSVSAARVAGPHLSARVTAALKESRLFYNLEPNSPGEDGTFWSKDWVRRASSSALLTWTGGAGFSVTGGIEYEDERQRGTSDFSASYGNFPDSIRVQRHNTGYFTQALIVAGRAAITLGGRLDENSQFGSHDTYRAGVVYRLPAALRLRASVGTGFKEPTFYENFAQGFVLGNPNLHPEQSRSWEVGVERGKIAVTYFNQRFRDLIEYNPAPPAGQPNYFNVDGAVADGIEAEASTAFSRSISGSLHYTFLHTRVVESGSPADPDGLFVPGKPLIRRPAHTLAPELTAAWGNSGHITVGALWVGKRDDLDFRQPVGQRRVTLGSYTRVNVGGDYGLRRGWVLTGRVANVFNDQHQEIPGFRALGRALLLGVRVTLD